MKITCGDASGRMRHKIRFESRVYLSMYICAMKKLSKIY